jgi:serine O-acetyltransferase
MTLDHAHPASVPVAPAKPESMRGETNQNPAGIGLWALLREDRRTHDGKWLEQGFWAVAVHRFGNWRVGLRPRLLRLPFSLVYKFLEKWVQWTCGITLPYTVKLGRRVRIWHHGGMVLHAKAIGDDVHIRQNTTFGVARRDRLYELPTIEDRVDIGCGAVILGDITVGHDSVIGANAVVLKDVPPHSMAAGVPAKVVKTLEAPA